MYAKRSLGQNFLTNTRIVSKIADAGNITNKDIVLEIGPGKGILTKELLSRAKKVIAIEKDDSLFLALQEKFKKEIRNKKLELIHNDARLIQLKKIGLTNHSYSIVANIPYNITGELFELFLTNTIQPKTIVFLVQKEVAERIVAKDKKESILSLSVKIFSSPKIMGVVGRGSFSPAPNVDSAILLLRDIHNPWKNKKEEEKFFSIVKSGFAHKRKYVAKNILGGGFTNVLSIFEKENIPTTSRAEDLPLEVWKRLAQKIN